MYGTFRKSHGARTNTNTNILVWMCQVLTLHHIWNMDQQKMYGLLENICIAPFLLSHDEEQSCHRHPCARKRARLWPLVATSLGLYHPRHHAALAMSAWSAAPAPTHVRLSIGCRHQRFRSAFQGPWLGVDASQMELAMGEDDRSPYSSEDKFLGKDSGPDPRSCDL